MDYARKNLISCPSLDKTKINGSVEDLMSNFFHHRIFSDEAKQIVYKEAEDAFRNKLDDANGITGIWQGEFWGKWIISAVQVCEYTGDQDLKEFIRKGVHNLLSMQEEDGYLGTYKNRLHVYPVNPVKLGELPVNMQWCRWNWNIWCRKYTLWGLLETYRLLGEKEILDSAVRFTNQLIDMLHENSIRIADTGMFVGLPSCSIMKPVLILYRETGNQKYLDFALEIAACWEEKSGRSPNLIANSTSSLPLHAWYADGRAWTKVYEMLSCLDGLLELYRCTGTQKYLDTVKNIYALIKKFDLNHMFSVGFNDQLAGASEVLNSLTEPCDAIHWMRAASELFQLTGESTYMDDFELAYSNAFLASINRSGKWGARAVRSHGHHYYAMIQAGFTHNHCCVNNVPRGFMNAASASVMYDDSGVFVNLYLPFTAELPQGEIKIGGDYLGSCQAVLDVKLKSRCKLRLRIPAWSKNSCVKYNGVAYYPVAGSILELEVDGAAVIDLQFDRTVKVKNIEYKKASPEAEYWYNQRFVSNESPVGAYDQVAMFEKNLCTLQYGTLLLAHSKYLGNTEDEIFPETSLYGKDVTCKLTAVSDPNVRQAFKAEITCENRVQSSLVCDYASAANEIIQDPRFFSIFF